MIPEELEITQDIIDSDRDPSDCRSCFIHKAMEDYWYANGIKFKQRDCLVGTESIDVFDETFDCDDELTDWQNRAIRDYGKTNSPQWQEFLDNSEGLDKTPVGPITIVFDTHHNLAYIK